MATIQRETYLNTASMKGPLVTAQLDLDKIVKVNKWYDTMGNPYSVYHMDNGDTHLYYGYGEMNGVLAQSAHIVRRKKDLFNRFA